MKISNLYIRTVSIFAVFICISTVLTIVTAITMNLFFRFSSREPEGISTPSYTVEATDMEKKISSAAKQFTPQGQILLIEQDENGKKKKYRKIYDGDYNLLWEGDIEYIPSEYATLAPNRVNIQPNSYIYTKESMESLFPNLKKYIVIYNRFDEGSTEIWRYNNGGYFEGFLNDQMIGYLGAGGFVKTKDLLIKFEDLVYEFAYTDDFEKSTPILLCRDNKNLYHIDIKKRQVALLLENVKDSRISLYDWFGKNSQGIYIGTMVVLRPERKPVVIFRQNLKSYEIEGIDSQTHSPVIAYSEKAANNSGYLLIAVNREGWPGIFGPVEARKQWINNYNESKHNETYSLYSLSDDGRAELINKYNSIIVPQKYVPSNQTQIDNFKNKTGYFLDISPVILHYLAKTNFAQDANFKSKVIREILELVYNFQPYHKSIAWILGCVCAAGVFVHNRNRTQSKAALAGWMAFALLFNVAGLLTCLALTHYDLIKCDNCGKKRHLLTENCLHCSRPMPSHLPQASDIMG